MFARWMDSNGWSHPVLTSLAKAAMGGQGWLHSSQISSLRHATTRNPGPRTFVAIERLNYYLWRYTEHKELIPGTKSSNDYNQAQPITENGQPPSLGWFVEVFCGYRVPTDFDLDVCRIPESDAPKYSKNLGRILRQLMMARGQDVVDDLGGVLYAHYPTQEKVVLDLIKGTALGTKGFSGPELEEQLPNLSSFLGALDGPGTVDDLLRELRR